MQTKLGSAHIMQKDLPDGTDFCFQIQVDQYLPVFRKFDILALQRRQARHNEMGLFCLNGIYYIRTLFQEKGECRLRSLNVIDEDILVKEADEFHCIGPWPSKCRFGNLNEPCFPNVFGEKKGSSL